MSSDTTPLLAERLAKGIYAPPTAGDIRSPCPIVNSLANHGHIPRNGKNVHPGEMYAAMNEIGLSTALGGALSQSIFLERHQPPLQRSWLGRLWYLLRHPWALLFAKFAMRRPGQKDSAGKICLNLDQLSIPGVVEHDVSMTRKDFAQGDNCSPDPDLISDLLACSSDGGKYICADDLVALRRHRINTQTKANDKLIYGPQQHGAACAEIALILDVFGDGQKMRCDYVRALFHEERLPTKEGWRKRKWWTVGLLEVLKGTAAIIKSAGVKF